MSKQLAQEIVDITFTEERFRKGFAIGLLGTAKQAMEIADEFTDDDQKLFDAVEAKMPQILLSADIDAFRETFIEAYVENYSTEQLAAILTFYKVNPWFYEKMEHMLGYVQQKTVPINAAIHERIAVVTEELMDKEFGKTEKAIVL